MANPPVFNQQFVDENGTKALSRLTSIKAIEEKQYNSGQNVVSFAVSPTDFVNQNIIRSMGVVDVNNIIGSPRYITGSGYSSLQSIQKDYAEYFNKIVKPNDYIRFFKDLTQGPSEMADEMAPARAKLLDGIVIESQILSRNKDTLVRSVKVDGSDTKAFIAYVSGSGSSWNSITPVGAYDFSVQKTKIDTTGSMTSDTLPLNATIGISGSVDMKESTKSSELPTFRRVLQKIGNYYVTSSLLDVNSSFATLDSTIVSVVSASTTSSGYPRNPFVGIPVSQSIVPRLPSENNTLTPFYDIPPRSDFSDVGSFTYFHKQSGVYSYDIYTLYKTPYITKLDTNVDIPSIRVYAPITLIASGSTQVEEYGRSSTYIPLGSYLAGTQYTGVISIANIFTLYGINGATGLRLRLYSDPAKQGADLARNFSTLPTSDSGVLFDGLLDNVQDVFPYLMIQSDNKLIYYTIDNQTTSTITSSVTFNYFAYEPDDIVPHGYLPRHYKFSRDNNTAVKRRNYLGCRDINTTFDQQSPFSVSISTQNTVVINTQTAPAPAGSGTVQIPTENTGITFGGGGQLNVE